jgi:creatinine amidohydrolase
MILRLTPKLVGPLAGIAPIPPGNAFLPAARGWITRDRTTPGHIGDPQAATAEKGEWLFGKFTAEVVALLERVLHWDGRSWEG